MLVQVPVKRLAPLKSRIFFRGPSLVFFTYCMTFFIIELRLYLHFSDVLSVWVSMRCPRYVCNTLDLTQSLCLLREHDDVAYRT